MKLQSLLLVDNLAIKWLILSYKSTKEFVLTLNSHRNSNWKSSILFEGKYFLFLKFLLFIARFVNVFVVKSDFEYRDLVFQYCHLITQQHFSLRSKIKLTNIHSRNFFHHHHPQQQQLNQQHFCFTLTTFFWFFFVLKIKWKSF